MVNIFVINECRTLTEQLICIFENAEKNLKNASICSISDLVGGNIFSGFMKHLYVNNANLELENVDTLLVKLKSILGEIDIPYKYKFEIGNFTTFADFMFDGVVVDTYMAAKIFSNLGIIKKMKKRLYVIHTVLEDI